MYIPTVDQIVIGQIQCSHVQYDFLVRCDSTTALDVQRLTAFGYSHLA
jgi:hypothetical protein